MRTSLVVLLVAVAPALASAATSSLGVTPVSFLVPDAQPGETYVQRVEVQNEGDVAATLTFEPEGEAGTWTRTVPEGPVEVPARGSVAVELAVTVPADAGLGPHNGSIRFIGEPGAAPGGSGLAVRQAIAVRLGIDVSGEPVERVLFEGVSVADVEVGSLPCVEARAKNTGNVRTEVRVLAEAVADGATEPASRGEAALELRPGESASVCVELDAPLPEGNHVARVRLEGAGVASWPPATPEVTAPFRVVPVGSLGKEGELRLLAHEPWVKAGRAVEVRAEFANTGETAIGRARLVGQARLDGDLVAALESEPLVVAPGETVHLVAYFTPPEDGTYTLSGRILYDGFTTPERTSLLNVQAEPGDAAFPRWGIAAAAVAAAAVVALWAWTRRRG